MNQLMILTRHTYFIPPCCIGFFFVLHTGTNKAGKLIEWNRFLGQKYSLHKQLPGFFLDNYDDPSDDAEMRAELQRLNTHVSGMLRFKCQDAQVGFNIFF